MSLGAISELLLRSLVELVLELIGYFTGRLLIPLVTLGRVHVEPVSKRQRWTRPVWRRLGKQADGTYVMRAETVALWGFLVWIAVGIAFALFQDASQVAR